MENKTFKKLISGTKSLKMVLGLGALAATATMGGAAQAAPTTHSPLQAQTHATTQADAKKISDAIRASKATDVRSSVAQAIAANPGVSREAVVAAINSMGYKANDMVSAVQAVSETMGISQKDVLTEMVADTFHGKGREAADTQMNALKESFGAESFKDFSLDSLNVSSNDIANSLSQISPAAGGDVYNG